MSGAMKLKKGADAYPPIHVFIDRILHLRHWHQLIYDTKSLKKSRYRFIKP
jgi:hypothetical protein